MQKELHIGLNDIIKLLREYASLKALNKTKHLHSCIIELFAEDSISISSALVHTYLRCRSLRNACSVFSNVLQPDVILWTTLITGYAQLGFSADAFSLFRRMHVEGVVPNHFTFASVLQACRGLGTHKVGKQVHTSSIEAGYGTDITVANVLINMYAKLGKIEKANAVFCNLHRRDVVSWSAMISCFNQHEQWERAISLFAEMHSTHLQPNNIMYVSILQACSGLNALNEGMHVHSQVVERDLELDELVRSTLVDVYVKFGNIDDARRVFDMMDLDLVPANALISGYAQYTTGDEALFVFTKMQHEGVLPDKVTFASTLKACASITSLTEGTRVHASFLESGLECDLFLASTLVDMYVKCDNVVNARHVFEGILERDVVLWNCLLKGYDQEACGQEAIALFSQMQTEGVFADAVTFVIMLKACIGMATLHWGKQAHAILINSSWNSNLILRSSLLDMYAKCGSLESARRLFDSTLERDVIAWNAMITAYAQQGVSKEVFKLFEMMQEEGLEPSATTLNCVLSACRHGGLVEDGCKYLEILTVKYGIELKGEHYGCIVDLFARVGRLAEAADFLAKLPFERTVEPWLALLSACKVHANVDAAERAFEQIEHLEPGHVGAVVLLSNIYAAAKEWGLVDLTREKLIILAKLEGSEEQDICSG